MAKPGGRKLSASSVQASAAESVARERRGSRHISRNRLALILGAIAFLVYANTIGNEYAYDDLSVIVKNTIVTKGISAIPEILSTPYRWGYYRTSNDLYRPLSQVMFAAEYQLFGGAATPLHFVNVLLFAGCVILLFLFLDALFEHRKTAVVFVASLLFALHPIHTEVVANIKSRDELLCFFFAFLSLNVFTRYVKNGRAASLIVGLLCFFLSLMSKETAVSMLGVVPLVFFFYLNENGKRSLLVTAGCVVAVAVFIGIRFAVLHAFQADHLSDIKFIDNFLSGAPSATSRVATAVLILGMYLKLLLIPYPLICDYGYNCIPFVATGNMWVVISLSTLVLLLVWGVYRLAKVRRDPVAFSILFFFVAIFMFSNIPFLIGAAMAERFMFFASVGFCLALALGIECVAMQLPGRGSFDPRNRTALFIIVPLSLVYIAITVNRNGEWHDSLTLYKADVDKRAGNARLYYYLGNELLISGEQQDPATQQQLGNEAIGYLKKALEVYPAYDDAHRVIGNGYFFVSRFDSAEVHLNKAIALNPRDMEGMNNLNVVFYTEHKFPEAIAVCRRMVAMDGHYAEGYNNIGVCFLHMERYDSAIHYLRKGLAVDKGYNSLYENLALAYKLSGATDSAKMYEAIAQRQHPGFRVF